MTSQVNPNNIDGTYPVAGQDNDSQGFRDNFTNIRNNLAFAKAEIEDIQNKAIFKTALSNSTLDNDFYGNIIANPSLRGYRETIRDIGASSGSVTLTFVNGNTQRIELVEDTYLTFSFPSNADNQYASIKLEVTVNNPNYQLYLPTAVSEGDFSTIAGLTGTNPPIITFTAEEIARTNKFMFEFYTMNKGTSIGIRDLTRNRSLSSTVSSTGNVVVGDNLITTGGRINSSYTYVTLVNNQNFYANTGYHTIFFDTAVSGTIANARVSLPADVVDGQEMVLSFLAPITSVWVNKGNTVPVMWFSNSEVSSGNVSVKLTYSSAASNWLRS